MDVLTYRPGEVVITVCGYVVEGWTSVALARNSPVFKQYRGIRGKNSRVKIKDSSFTLRLTMTQTTVTNDVFSSLLQLDERTGTARLEVVVKDTAGTSLLSSSTAYFEGYPETTYSASQTERVWTLLCDTADDYVVGGNAHQGIDFSDILSRLSI